MLLIHEKEEIYKSEACAGCTEGVGYGMCCYDVCEDCEEKIKTIFECPHCSTTHSFFGSDEPIYCENCKKLLPNILNLKKDTNKRITYYNKPETV